MRILFLSDTLSRRGGADHYLLEMIRYAASAGHQIELAVGRVEEAEALPKGVRVHQIRGLSSSVDSGKGLTKLAEPLRSADLVHLQNIMNPTAIRRATESGNAIVTVQDHRVFCPSMGKTMPDGSRCTTELGSAPCDQCLPDAAYRESMVSLTQERRKALAEARLVVLSHYMARELAVSGLTGAKIIPLYVPEAADRQRPGNDFLLAGRLVAHKGVLAAWSAWNLAERPLPLRIAGAGPLEAQLEDTKCLGWLTQEALASEIRHSRALLFPAFWQEPFGILGLQALAQGTPVIVDDKGGTRDWSHAGSIVIREGCFKAFSEAIARLARDPEFALRLGREGQEMVRQRFGFDRWAANLDALWSRTAG